MKRTLLALALPLLLAACTGTDESVTTLQVAVLTDGGATLRTVTPGADTDPAPVREERTVPVTGGVSLETLPSGSRLALTLRTGLESRSAELQTPQPFAPLPFAETCLTQTVASAQRDRLLTLSECGGGPQQLALYRNDGTLVWTARLPTALPPTPGQDTPPLRLAVRGNVGVVARPRVGGGSEVMRAAPQNLGDPVAVVSTPLPTAAIRDLAPYGAEVLAATDSGVQRLRDTGEPDGTALPAFGTSRFDRLWSGGVGNRTLLAAWRSNIPTGLGAQPLLLWDGSASRTASTVALLSDLRDVTLALDGNLYALTATTLIRYDTVFGLQQNNWRPRTLLGTLNDARAVTWLVP
ncbi:hypothetical protein [Deinococcus aerophilus]|uniref:Uncharacterized protein n=1 Tax=Deinococcus aerophilus TaxID=522488 RepID=A0ABQ2H101_9DEIO|nr:hypothetical protein [Deinococcus aerophilus]GGM21236.1 hypothetical protein GCM10010841_31460 [Deinococcus aerophilus]